MKKVTENKIELFHQILSHKTDILSYGVKRLGIFGSFVRNENDNASDIDFLVEFEQGKKNYKNFIGLAFYLEELSGRKVDLLTEQSLSKYIGPYILKETEYVI